MNRGMMISNLSEARGELNRLIEELESPGSHYPYTPNKTEYWFIVGFKHAYDHINTAWNMRRSKPGSIRIEDYDRWGKFPMGKEWEKRFYRVNAWR
jgi:hypothetical protein